jgi:hypothetical protein
MHPALFAAFTLFAAPALAQDAISLSAVRAAQVGFGAPSLTAHAAVDGEVSMRLACAGRSFDAAGRVRPGDSLSIELGGLPQGSHTCTGSLTLQADDGTSGEMPLSLSVDILPPLSLAVDREKLDLEGRFLTVRADRPLSRVKVEAIGVGGAALGQGEITGHGSPEVSLQWSGEGEVVKLVLTAWDVDDLPGQLELVPWSYAIPHEDVVFASGADVVTAAETPKLEAAWTDLQAVLARYGSVVEVRLFVAGYTDTVGASGSNQALSERRARSIAAWFRQRGFSGPISYQGFGEDVLAVGTPDETDEAANRRAIYLLAAQAPPISPEVPRAAWRAL